jgi:Holliday junction DNA helicase RuvA
MLHYLKGQLISLDNNHAILEIGGLGLRVSITGRTANELNKKYSPPPAALKISTYLHIQENKWEIFGFLDEKEREAFLLLLGCRGVGPKAALNILNALTPSTLKEIALGEKPVTTLQQVSGIGAKSADRILVELKEKLPEMRDWREERDSKKKNILEYTHEDLSNALRHLGYHSTEIQVAITNSSTLPTTLSEAVKQLLRVLGKG